MSYYANHKDPFNSDTTMWVDKTANSVITFVAGEKVFTRNGDSWSNGHHHEDLKGFGYGDAILYEFDVDVLNAGDTYHFVAFSAGAAPDYSAGGVGVYFYPDSGVKAHGQNGGGIAGMTGINLPQTLTQGDRIQVLFVVTPVTGFLNVYLKGGPWAAWTKVVDGGSTTDMTPAGPYASWKLFHGIYSSNSDCSIRHYGWSNASGPTPDVPTSPTATATGETTGDVEWTDAEDLDFFDGTKVERSTTSGSGFSEVDDVAPGTGISEQTGLSAGTTYYFKMRNYFVLDGVTYYSAYTSEVSFTTTAVESSGGSPIAGRWKAMARGM